MEHFDFYHPIIIDDMKSIYSRRIDWNLFNNKTFFISGAYGMLASYIVFFLMYLNIYEKFNITVIAQGRSKEKANYRFHDFFDNDNFLFTDADILNDIHVDKKIDYIIHAASPASPNFYLKKPIEVILPNSVGTYHLLNLAKTQKVEKFLYFSSVDIYGKTNSQNGVDEKCVGSIDTLDVHSCYGESKRLGETLCSSYYREYEVNSVIARIAHTYGPTMNVDEDPRVFADFMNCILNNKDIVVKSDGSAKRSFCYIADAVYAFMLLLLKGDFAEAYNVSNTDQFLSIRELADIMCNICQNSIKAVFAQRSSNDNYIENELNKKNIFWENKLLDLGWNHEFTASQGLERVYKFLCDTKQKEK